MRVCDRGRGIEGRMLGNDPGVSDIYIQRRGIPTRFTNRTRDSFGRPWPKRNFPWCNPLISTGKVVQVEDVTFLSRQVLTDLSLRPTLSRLMARLEGNARVVFAAAQTPLLLQQLGLWCGHLARLRPHLFTLSSFKPCTSKLTVSKRTFLTKEFSGRRNSGKVRR